MATTTATPQLLLWPMESTAAGFSFSGEDPKSFNGVSSGRGQKCHPGCHEGTKAITRSLKGRHWPSSVFLL